jgi:hypothetical protein
MNTSSSITTANTDNTDNTLEIENKLKNIFDTLDKNKKPSHKELKKNIRDYVNKIYEINNNIDKNINELKNEEFIKINTNMNKLVIDKLDKIEKNVNDENAIIDLLKTLNDTLGHFKETQGGGGGGSSNYYKNKYLKYKNKYLSLKYRKQDK